MINYYVFSIKPHHATNIYTLSKKFELRRVVPKDIGPDDIIYLYETLPVQLITGFIVVSKILTMKTFELWLEVQHQSCINLHDYFEYAGNRKIMNAIKIEYASRLEKPIRPKFSGGHPPQNFIRLQPGMIDSEVQL